MLYFKTNVSVPLSYYKSGQFICEKNWQHKSVILENDYEIIIGIKGTIYIKQNEDKYEVNPGDVLFLPPGMLYSGYAPSDEGSSFYWLHFLCTANEIILTKSEIYQEIISILNPKNTHEDILLPTFLSLIDTGKVFIYIKQILHIANSLYYTHLSTDYLVSELTIELTQQFINSFSLSVTKENSVNKRFFQILEWIRVNITKDISVQLVARKSNFSADHLTRLFKKHIGMSTLQYINSIKINKAKELLLNSEKSIKEISYTLCFRDEKYFMKLFKKYEGITPTQYRDAYPKTYINTDSSDPLIPLPSYLSHKK